MQCTGEGGAEEEGAVEEVEGGVGSLSEVSSICTSSGCLPACELAAMAGMAFFCSGSDVSLSHRALTAEGSMKGSDVKTDDCGYGQGSGFI